MREKSTNTHKIAKSLSTRNRECAQICKLYIWDKSSRIHGNITNGLLLKKKEIKTN